MKHPDENRFRRLRVARGLYQKDMAKLLDIDQRTYSSYETGRRKPSPQVLKQIHNMECETFGESQAKLLNTTATVRECGVDYGSIPMMAWASAGSGGEEVPVDWQETIQVPGIQTREAYALRVVGDSMVNVIMPGDLLIVVPIPLSAVKHGLTYVFVTRDEGTCVKQFFKHQDAVVRLHSYNRERADLFVHSETIFKSYEIIQHVHPYREVQTIEYREHLITIEDRLERIESMLRKD